ncbi:hypothetical protein HanIR_Chr13g0666951 [Helianthus annuus]|nr:hypothetical protein HanIR_Chr13g0666951 [Helianthus annuus]
MYQKGEMIDPNLLFLINFKKVKNHIVYFLVNRSNRVLYMLLIVSLILNGSYICK